MKNEYLNILKHMTAWQTAHDFFGKYCLLRATSFPTIPATEGLLSSCLDSCFLEKCFQPNTKYINKLFSSSRWSIYLLNPLGNTNKMQLEINILVVEIKAAIQGW